MATYVVIANHMDQRIRGVKDTVKRAAALKASAQKAGVKVKELSWTRDQHDIVTILEAPDRHDF